MAEAYKSSRRATGGRDVAPPPGTPAAARELRAQGRKTMRKLLDAGMRVFAFTDIATALGSRMRDAGARGDVASISALMALLERFAYFLVSRELEFDTDTLFDTVTRVVHRGFFGAPLAA